MSRRSNWDKVRKRKPKDTLKYRDVYDDQQLDRGDTPEPQPFAPRVILSFFLALFVSLFFYCILSMGAYGMNLFAGLTGGRDHVGVSTGVDASVSSSEGSVTAPEEGDLSFSNGGGGDAFSLDENGNTVFDPNALPGVSMANGNGGSASVGSVDADVNTVGNGSVVLDPMQVGSSTGFSSYFLPTKTMVFWTVIFFILFFALVLEWMYRDWKLSNIQVDHTDINQNHNDQHIALPEEIQRQFDWFPDVGAHCGVQVSSMISHFAVKNKGIKTIRVAKRYEKDVLDEDGSILYYKGELMLDENDEPIYTKKSLFDLTFMDDLYEASEVFDKSLRVFYDLTKIPYNPEGRNRDKLGKYATVADMINADWEFPAYEPQRPGGCYLVDTAPVNTMV